MSGYLLGVLLVLECGGYVGRVESGEVRQTSFDLTGYKPDWDCEQTCKPKESQESNPVIFTTMKSMKNAEYYVTVAVIELEVDQPDRIGRKKIPLATYLMYKSPKEHRLGQKKDEKTLRYLYGSIRYNKILASTVEVGVLYNKVWVLSNEKTADFCHKITYSISANMKVKASNPEIRNCPILESNYQLSSTKYVPMF